MTKFRIGVVFGIAIGLIKPPNAIVPPADENREQKIQRWDLVAHWSVRRTVFMKGEGDV
jgi:hypothetical protein